VWNLEEATTAVCVEAVDVDDNGVIQATESAKATAPAEAITAGGRGRQAAAAETRPTQAETRPTPRSKSASTDLH